jgi:hypothetical protein
MQSWVLYKSSILCDVEYGLCLCESLVFHPLRCDLAMRGLMSWFKQWLEWWRWFIPSWHVVLSSFKDRIIGVDTLGQHVPSRVWYGTACLLISYVICCVSCSVECECHHTLCLPFIILWDLPKPHGARGDVCAGNLSTARGGVCSGNRSKAWHTPVVDFCNGM